MAKQVVVPDEKGRSFARAVRSGQFLFISGMTGQWDLTTWERDPRSVGDVAYQTRRIFEWVQKVLAQSGLTLKDLVSTTTYVRRIEDTELIGRIKREFMPDADVASSTVQVSGFVGTGDLEINFIAAYPEGRQTIRSAQRWSHTKLLHLPEAGLRDLYEAELALIRPDQHVAWRGGARTADAPAALRRAVGF